MKLKTSDLEFIRSRALSYFAETPTPIYLNQEEIPERHNVPFLYTMAVLDFLEKNGLIKEKIEIDSKRIRPEPVE